MKRNHLLATVDNGNPTELPRHLRGTRIDHLIAGALFLGFSFLYLFLNRARVASSSPLDHPFGSDVWIYRSVVTGAEGVDWWQPRHPLVQVLLYLYGRVYQHLTEVLPPLLAQKLPFALLGAATVVLLYILGRAIGGDRLRALAFAMICGCSGTLLFFASTPEWGMVSAFFSTAAFVWMQSHRDHPSWGSVALSVMLITCAVLCEIMSVLLVAIPLAHALEMRRQPSQTLLRHLLTALLGLLGSAVALESFFSWLGRSTWSYYVEFFDKNVYAVYIAVCPEACLLLGLFVHPLAFPGPVTTFAQPMYRQPYFGYFEPSLEPYFESLPGILFLACLCVGGFVAMAYWVRSRNWLSTACLGIIGVRAFVVYVVIAHEAFMASASQLVPLALFLTSPLLQARARPTGLIMLLFSALLAACNLPFFIP